MDFKRKKYRRESIEGKLERSRAMSMKYMDIIVSSGEIKKLLLERCKELNLSVFVVAQEAGVGYYTFRNNYLKKDDPQCSPSIRQEHIIDMLEVVGVDLRVVVLKKEPDMERIARLKKIQFKNYDKKPGRSGTDQDLDDRYPE